MTIIIDYDLGNVGSILNILHILGEKAKVSRDKDEILKADRLILPGVGSFDVGMSNLQKYGLIEPILQAANSGTPILGICLGMQLLGRRSDEGVLPGLSLIPFDTLRFPKEEMSNLKIPHMGWDIVDNNADVKLLENLSKDQRYYFVHSFYAKCDSEENVLMYCDYGIRFAAAVYKNNIYGVQFHPEKSHNFGIDVFKNFVRIQKNV